MIFSMTGYGRIEKQLSNYQLIIDIKSLNGKYLDVISKISDTLSVHENKIISKIKKKCIRGKVFLNISLKTNSQFSDSNNFNDLNFKNYYSKIEKLQKKLGINSNPSIEHFLKVPEIFEPTNDIDFNKDNKILYECLDKAIKQLIIHREKEGKIIYNDISSKIKIINADIKKIVRLSVTTKAKELKKIKEKINFILSGLNLDENRLYQEIAIILEKKDINEEIIRLNGHIALLKQIILEGESVGKKINFLLQEITREINTVGSKVENIKIKHLVVNVKNNIEQIREQAQNIL